MKRDLSSCRLVWLIGVLVAMLASPAEAELPEGQLKALVVERFTRFIDWPNLGEGAFEFCVLGAGGTVDDLTRFAATLQFKRRLVKVHRLKPAQDAAFCDLLFIAASEAPRLPRVLAAVRGRPVLTVSDSPGFAERGVLINLYQEGEFIRFEVNLEAVSQSSLVFSSKLLRLARLIGMPKRPP